MSAFIKLNKQDAFVVPYTAHKTWTVESSSLADYGIEVYTATSSSYTSSLTTYPTLAYRTYVLPDDGTFDTYTASINEYAGGRFLSPGYLDIEYDQILGSPIRARIYGLDNNNVDISSAVGSWTYFEYKVGVTGPGMSIRSGSIANIVDEGYGTYTFDITGGSVDSYGGLYSITNPQDLDVTPTFSTTTIQSSSFFNPQTSPTTGQNSLEYRDLIFNSIRHLYYSGVFTGAESSSSYEDYKQTTLHTSSARSLDTFANVIAIPRNVVGSAIKPGTFALGTGEYVSAYVSGGYVLTGYVVAGSAGSYMVYDDGEGKLYASGSTAKIGDIIYTHGLAILTDSASISSVQSLPSYSMHWQSTYEVYTHNYKCRVREQDLNYSQNPSIKSGSNGDIYDFATGSYFQPYVTTVGLYNDSNELIAVGKLGQPIPKSRYNDMTFVITLDI
jgi:hypothetical protein